MNEDKRRSNSDECSTASMVIYSAARSLFPGDAFIKRRRPSEHAYTSSPKHHPSPA
jgi:hypothetical protein